MVELDGVPTVGRGPRPKAKAKLGRDLVKQQMLETQRCAEIRGWVLEISMGWSWDGYSCYCCFKKMDDGG